MKPRNFFPVMIISCMHAQIRHVKSFLKLKNMEKPFSFTLFTFDVMPQSGALDTMFHSDKVFGLLSWKCHITNHVLSKCTGHHQCEKHLTHTFVHGIWRQLVSKNNQILEYEVTACRTDGHRAHNIVCQCANGTFGHELAHG